MNTTPDPQDPMTEGKAGIGRIEAFSDGVLAIAITIMVLELKAPEAEDFSALARLWPTFLAYVLSFLYVAIYWVNHHRLFSHAIRVTNGLLWSNMALLFFLSLIPFTTAYLGEHHFNRDSTLLYETSLLLSAIAYAFLQRAIAQVSHEGRAAQLYHLTMTRKTWAAVALYAAGLPLSFVTPWLGVGIGALVGLFWVLPSSRLDRLFLCGQS